jgi:hypothetical protein
MLSELPVCVESYSNKFEMLYSEYEDTEDTQSIVYRVRGVLPAGIYSRYLLVRSIDVSQPLSHEEYHLYDDHII